MTCITAKYNRTINIFWLLLWESLMSSIFIVNEITPGATQHCNQLCIIVYYLCLKITFHFLSYYSTSKAKKVKKYSSDYFPILYW